jgi:flagellar basal-body rod protein FlgB
VRRARTVNLLARRGDPALSPGVTSPISEISTATLRMALTGLDMRQQAIADNIANIETPGFLAKQVDFEDSLRAAAADGEPGAVSFDTSRSLAATRLNGNNVNVDVEVMANSEVKLRQALAINALNAEYTLLRTAINGR